MKTNKKKYKTTTQRINNPNLQFTVLLVLFSFVSEIMWHYNVWLSKLKYNVQ